MGLPAFATAATGQVRDRGSGQPIAGAIVQHQATTQRVWTDTSGRFAWDPPLPAGSHVVAGAVGYFSAGAPWLGTDLDLVLDPVPFEPASTAALLAPAECGACHPRQVAEWSASAMAHAGTNTWVYDLYNGSGTAYGQEGFVYTRDSIHAGVNPASECGACHAPERWLTEQGAALPALASAAEPEIRGVSCTLCHNTARIDNSRSHFPGLVGDVMQVNLAAEVRYGVLGDVDFHAPNRMRASYQPALAADLCAACHQDSSDPDNNHTFAGPVSEPTYEEWRASPYADPAHPLAATCVDCHTTAVESPTASPVATGYERPLGTVRSHDFAGTTPAFLQKALQLDVQAARMGGKIQVTVTVTNTGAGHHVPTGVTMRNIVLLVEARDDLGSLMLRSGPVVEAEAGVGDPANGYYAGLPGRLYAKVTAAADGRAPVLFTEATAVTRDNRLAALATDRTTYQFALPRTGAGGEVRARLIYRRAFRDLVDVKQWTTDGHGRPLQDLAPPHFGQLMAETSVRLAALPTAPQPDWGCQSGPVAPRPGTGLFGFTLLLTALARATRRGARHPAQPDTQRGASRRIRAR